jgi:outer membrane protein OmpA-like peptidoglycan-associated protein
LPANRIFAAYSGILKYTSLLLFCLFTFSAVSQSVVKCPDTSNNRAKKYLEDAKEARKKKKPSDGIRELILKAAEADSTWAAPWKLLGDMGYQSHNDTYLREGYSQYLLRCPDSEPELYYRMGVLHYESKEFAEAISNFRSFLDFEKVREENARDAQQRIYRAELMLQPVSFNPQLLRDISTADPEYLAVISPDQELCFFTRRFEELKRGSLTPVSVEKFMIARKKGDVFDKGEPMPLPFNKSSSGNEGGATISIDNKHLFFTTNKNGNFDIYTSDEEKGKWSEPRSIGASVNDPLRWESQPCISPDGKKLFFASFRDSINQTSDLYVSARTTNGWGQPELLDSKINTAGNEKTPYLHPDNITLYFSSDGLPGMGGYDIFYSRMENGKWTAPKNLGYPINTESDEVGFFVSTDGKNGYFSSNSLKGSGGYDIYSFELPESVRPAKVLFIKGELNEEGSGPPYNSKIELTNTRTDEKVQVDYDSLTGQYASVVRFDEDYIMTIKKKGFAYNSIYFSQDDSTLATPKNINLQMRKTEVGQAYTLNNILFAKNSAVPGKQDSIIVRDFASYLKEYNTIQVAIHGHTDSDGNDNDNMILSENRAKAVYDLLVKSGVKSERLSYKGFGETNPISENSTTAGRSQNRRTEFVVVSK